MNKLTLLCIVLFSLVSKGYSQNFAVSIGTDIPYQHYLGVQLETRKIDFSYRTGLLVPPYSDALLGIIQGIGADQVYVDLLETAYDFGWMNSLGAYYKFGQQQSWYAGAEFRVDYLTASSTPEDLIEAISGQSIRRINNREVELALGVINFATGLRIGKEFSLDSDNKHFLRTEL
jgi:hypothetical protein